MTNVVPFPSSLSTLMVPPWYMTACFTMARPRPVPPVSFDRLEETLVAKLTGTEDPTVSLHCDKSVPIEEVVKVMNIAMKNKFKLILATRPE